MVERACRRALWAYAREALDKTMPTSLYEGGKRRRHLTLSDQAYAHLSAISSAAQLSKSEAVERILRGFSFYEADILKDEVWPSIIDHSIPGDHGN
jgi:hypothetical protein